MDFPPVVPVGLTACKAIATIREHGTESIALIAQGKLALGYVIEECGTMAQKLAATAKTPSA